VSIRELKQLIEETVNEYPATIEFSRMSKHECVIISTDKGTRKLPFSVSANHRAHRNMVTQIKRTMRNLGVEPKPPCMKEAKTEVATGSLGEKLLDAQARAGAEQQQQHKKNGYVESDKPEKKKRSGFVKLLQGEIVTVTRLLMENLNSDPKLSGVVSYKPGWSDERIAQILASSPDRGGVTSKLIAVFRKEHFGKLKDEVAAKSKQAQREEYIATLERIINELVYTRSDGKVYIAKSEGYDLCETIDGLEEVVANIKSREVT